MVKKNKTVERERTKKPKTTRKTEIIKNEKGSGNQNINQISVRIVDPTKSNKQKKKEELAERRKKKKLEAIEKLKEELSTFRQLKEEARIKNILLPASLGQTPSNINDVSSVKAVNLLIEEIEQRNLQIQQLLQSKQVEAPNDMMAGVFGSGGISGNERIIPQQPTIIPQQPAQPAQQPAQQPTTTDFNRELQQINSDLETIKIKLSTLIDDTDLKNKFPINDENISKINQNLKIAKDLFQQLFKITGDLERLDNNVTNQRDRITIEALKDDYKFEIGEISISGIKQLSNKLLSYMDNLQEWLFDARQPAQQPDQPAQQPDQPAQQPDQPAQQPADTTQQTLKEIRDEIIAELRKENKPIPDDIDQQAQQEFQEQQEEQPAQQEQQPAQKEEQPAQPPPQPQVSDSKIPPELQTEIDNVKRNSGDNNFNNRLQVLIEDTLREPNQSNLDRLDNLTHRNIPTRADEYAIHDIFNKVENIVKPQIQPAQQQPTQETAQQKRERLNRERDEKQKQIQKEMGEVEKLTGVKEAPLNGKTVPKGWYNDYWLKYQELTKDIKNDIVENEGGIFQIPEDKLENIKQRREQLKTDYTNFKDSLSIQSKSFMRDPTISQYDSAITQGLNSSIKDIVTIILNQEGKAVSQIVIGNIEDTPIIKSTRERFIAGGDFINLLDRLEKQYKGTIEIKELREVNDKIEQAKTLATRTFRSLGQGEVNVKSAYQDYLKKLQQLQLEVNQKILSTEKPPRFTFEMEQTIEPGEKIPVDKGFIERTPEGKFIYKGNDIMNFVKETERLQKTKPGGLPSWATDITGDKP